jgi:DNA primase
MNSVVVVESPMSVAKAHSLGVANVVATFGAKVSQNQIDFLKGFSEVIVWFDADNAGDLAARKVAKNLYRHTTVKLVVSEEGKDLADYDSADQINRMIDSAVPAILLLSQWDKEKNGSTKKKGS